MSNILSKAFGARSGKADASDLTDLQRTALGLEARMPAGKPFSLSIVSPRNGEGRSHMAAWLAIAFARMGRSCILVDGDLRHPRLHEWFGVSNEHGVAAMLDGRAEIDCGTTWNAGTDLRVVAAGTLPDVHKDPLALWHAPVSAPLFTRWLSEADVVIVDTPRALTYPDAQVIAPQTDACVLVARQDVSYLAELSQTRDLMREAHANVLGCLHNMHPHPMSLRQSLALRPPRLS